MNDNYNNPNAISGTDTLADDNGIADEPRADLNDNSEAAVPEDTVTIVEAEEFDNNVDVEESNTPESGDEIALTSEELFTERAIESLVHISAPDEPLREVEWQLDSVPTMDKGAAGFRYTKIYCLMREFEGDTYTREDLKLRAARGFAMLHTLMDLIRKNLNSINPKGGMNYVEALSEKERNALAVFSSSTLKKRAGKPRLVTTARFGFPLIAGGNENLKIVIYEHSDPLETYQYVMETLEPMAVVAEKINTLHQYYEEMTIDLGAAPLSPSHESPVTQTQSQPINYSQNQITDMVDCWGDEDAQEADPGSLIVYRASKIYYKDGKFAFYMPTREKVEAGIWNDTRGARGVYTYENSNQTLFDAARQDGRLPYFMQNGESLDHYVIVIALKVKTKNGGIFYTIQDLQFPPTSA